MKVALASILLSVVSGRSRSKRSDISMFHTIRSSPHRPKVWPPRLPPLLRVQDFPIYGHYPHKNKIAKNGGWKNVRDGGYVTNYIGTWGNSINRIGDKGRWDTTTDSPRSLILSTTKQEIGNQVLKDAVGKLFCPPRNLRDFSNHLLVLSALTGGQWGGTCTNHAWMLNMHASRLFALLGVAFEADQFPGNFAGVGEPGIAYKTLRLKSIFAEVGYFQASSIIDMVEKGRPVASRTFKGTWRPDVEFIDKRRVKNWIPLTMLCVIFGMWAFWNFLLCVEYTPFIFYTFTKNKAHREFNVKKSVCFLEGCANFFESLQMIGGMGWTPGAFPNTWKGMSVPSFLEFGSFFNYTWKLWACVSTILVSTMWTNESLAAKHMRPAKPILKEFTVRLYVVFIIMMYLQLNDIFAFTLQMGHEGASPLNPTTFYFILYPIICASIGVYFQTQAGSVVTLVSADANNQAMVEFRKKLIKNLARAGIIDATSFFVILGASGNDYCYGPHGMASIMFMIDMFRVSVSYFQVISIEPPQVAKRRVDARRKVAVVSSRASFSSTSSMSSTSSSTSSMSSSSESSVSSSSSTSESDTATTTTSSVA